MALHRVPAHPDHRWPYVPAARAERARGRAHQAACAASTGSSGPTASQRSTRQSAGVARTLLGEVRRPGRAQPRRQRHDAHTHTQHRRGVDLRAAVERMRHWGGAARHARRAPIRVPAGAGSVHDRAASTVRQRQRPCSRAVDAVAGHRRHRGTVAASPVSRDGLSWRALGVACTRQGIDQGRRCQVASQGEAHCQRERGLRATHAQGCNRGGTVRAPARPIHRRRARVLRHHLDLLRGRRGPEPGPTWTLERPSA